MVEISTLSASANVLPSTGYVREAQLVTKKGRQGLIPFSPATLWRKVASGEFPKPVKLSAGVTAWRVEDIRAWIETKAAAPAEHSAPRGQGARSELRYVTIGRFSAASGYSEDAIRSKIRDGIWREGHEWKRAPDGRVLIDVDGYHEWVEGAGTFLKVHHKKPGRGGSPPPLVVTKRIL